MGPPGRTFYASPLIAIGPPGSLASIMKYYAQSAVWTPVMPTHNKEHHRVNINIDQKLVTHDNFSSGWVTFIKLAGSSSNSNFKNTIVALLDDCSFVNSSGSTLEVYGARTIIPSKTPSVAYYSASQLSFHPVLSIILSYKAAILDLE